MEIELITRADFHSLKTEIVDEIKKLFQVPSDQKEWMKSTEVMKMLSCSPGTLQNLRVNGTLPFTKMGGTMYYSRKDVMKTLENNKKNAAWNGGKNGQMIWLLPPEAYPTESWITTLKPIYNKVLIKHRMIYCLNWIKPNCMNKLLSDKLFITKDETVHSGES